MPYIRHFYMRWKLILLICFFVHFTVAQQMKMETHHQINSASKNIFLLMMDSMMIKMDAVPVTSRPDIDFMSQMIPHHQGAIGMAKYETGHGKNNHMMQLAKSIIAEQNSEIQLMKILINRLNDSTQKINKSFSDEMADSMKVMMKNMPSDTGLNDIDKAFAMVMIPHHQAAIHMAAVLIKYSVNNKVATFAKQLISEEQIEIEQMSAFINE